MDAISMMRVAAGLLAIAALGGLAMAFVRFTRKVNPPAWLAMLHGFLAAAALTLLLYAAFTVGVPGSAKIALGLFVVAALGGAALNLGYQWKQRLLPGALVAGHAVAAVAGFGFLLLAAFVD
jgi:glucose uptake protein GlcU